MKNQTIFQWDHTEIDKIFDALKTAAKLRDYPEVERLFNDDLYAAEFERYMFDIKKIGMMKELRDRREDVRITSYLDDVIRDAERDKEDLKQRLINWDEEIKCRIYAIKQITE